MRRVSILRPWPAVFLIIAAGCVGNADVTLADAGRDGRNGGGGSTGGSGAGASGNPGIGGNSSGTPGTGGGTPGTAGSSGGGGTTGAGGGGGPGGGTVGACSSTLASRVRVNEIDVGVTYAYNEVDNNGPNLGLTLLAISPLPAGGSRLAFLGKSDGMVHIVTLDGNDMITGSAVTLPGYDFQDIYADAAGATLLISRPAMGSTASQNCGNINNLCGLTANYPTTASCYDMYMVRVDGATETWATKLTDTTGALPAYSTGATTGSQVVFIWSEYAHNGRIAFDGANYAAYFGVAITAPNQMCVDANSTLKTGVNIHQGDREKIVSSAGALQSGGFGIGCSHSGYERVIYDPTAKKFVSVCKNDLPTGGKSGRIAFPSPTTTITPVDLNYSDLGNVMMAGGGGYWIINSDIRTGQTPMADGLADVHLYHLASTSAPTPDKDLTVVSDGANDRAPHLAAYGSGLLLAAWETSTAKGDLMQNAPGRQMYLQVLDATTGGVPGGSTTDSAGPLKVTPNVLGSRYQDFRAFPDGSVAYPAPGSTGTKIKVLRVLPCSG
jgi:hypothetical protein